MAAVMSADLHNTDRLVTLKDDCRHLLLKLLAPDINKSGYHFSVSDDETILYGLGAIKGVGRGAVESLIAEREANGPYQGLTEFHDAPGAGGSAWRRSGSQSRGCRSE